MTFPCCCHWLPRVSLTSLRTARYLEAKKRRKYTDISLERDFEQLPFAVESCGGMGPSGDKLIKAMAETSEEHLAVWSREDVIRELVGSVAMAVQRGGAMTYLEGYDKALHAMYALQKQAAKKKKMEEQSDSRETESEGGEGNEGRAVTAA